MWILAEGMNPKPVRQDLPPGSSSYGWDRVLGATLENAGGRRYFVGIVDWKIARLAPVDGTTEIPASDSESPERVETVRCENPAISFLLGLSATTQLLKPAKSYRANPLDD
jgi:hypothetical protein